jgi:hypothetical protein
LVDSKDGKWRFLKFASVKGKDEGLVGAKGLLVVLLLILVSTVDEHTSEMHGQRLGEDCFVNPEGGRRERQRRGERRDDDDSELSEDSFRR